jgi:hypothetical protein
MNSIMKELLLSGPFLLLCIYMYAFWTILIAYLRDE